VPIAVTVALSEETVGEIDRLVAEGRFGDRAEAVRAAVDRLLGELGEERPADDAWAEAAARAVIVEAPWP
jgi:Arc/MetJ-type ribon-helix-helix transcriptional regulator